MPDHPRVSEVLSLSSITSFSSLKPPVPLARALVITTAWVSEKNSRGKGHPDVRPGSPTSGAGHPP